jgi:MOSC domain
VKHLTTAELEAGLDDVRRSPKDEGTLRLIVRRPDVGVREVVEAGELDLEEGLVGDRWFTREGVRSSDGTRRFKMQLTIMNSRVIALVAQEKNRWSLSGDQLFIDLDLSAENMPPGTRLALGLALIEVTDEPHANCRKFGDSFGMDAMKLVHSPVGTRLQLRGINARVIRSGAIRVGDAVRKAPIRPGPIQIGDLEPR